MSEATPINLSRYVSEDEATCAVSRSGKKRVETRDEAEAALKCRIALLIEYIGKNFHGSQSQKNQRTVQAVLERAIGTWLRLKEPVPVVFSGRTDSGVHAAGQVAHFDWPVDFAQLSNLDLEALCWGLNGILPEDMSIRNAVLVDSGFHARFTATQRQYVYSILNHKQRSPLLKDTHYFIRQPLDIEKMQEAITCLIGSHDFAAFKSTNSDRMTTICNVSHTQLLHLGEGELEFSIAANHFVYNMVRIIAGTVVEIGLSKRGVSSLELALRKRERQLAGPTAPAWGLCLNSVKYPSPYTHIFVNRKAKEISSENLQCVS